MPAYFVLRAPRDNWHSLNSLNLVPCCGAWGIYTSRLLFAPVCSMANANPPQSIPLCFVLEYSWAMCLTHRFGTPEHSIQPQLLGVRIEILDRRVQPQLLGVWIKILDYRVQPQLLGVWIEILDRRVQPQLLGVWIEILDRRVQPQLLGVWIEILDRRVQLQLLGVWIEILDRRVQLQLLGVWVVAVNFCRTMVVKPSHHR